MEKTSLLSFLVEAKKRAQKENKKLLVVNFDFDSDVVKMLKHEFKHIEFIPFRKTIDLENVGYVLIGRTVKHLHEHHSLVKLLDHKKIPYFSYGAKNPEKLKDSQYRNLKKAGVSQIPSWFKPPKEIDVDSAIRTFGLPMVIKTVSDVEGKNVLLIKTAEQLKKYLNDSKESIITIQKFIENDGDWCLLFVDRELIYSVLRKAPAKNGFRNNSTISGEELKAPNKIIALAKKAHQHANLDISGVDVIEDKRTGEIYVLEVNAAPNFFSHAKRLRQVMNKIILQIRKKYKQ